MEKKKKNKKLREGVTTRSALAPHGGDGCKLYTLSGVIWYNTMREGYCHNVRLM